MSTTRIKSIKAREFKALRDLDLKLDGKHLLAWGLNGSGKSSLYHALRMFLDSGAMKSSEVHSMFSSSILGSSKNIFAAHDDESSITIEFTEQVWTADHYSIGNDRHETNIPGLRKAHLASDFITYRVLYDFYHEDERGEIDLWPVFEREMLPFCSTSVIDEDIETYWKQLKSFNPEEEIERRKTGGPGIKKVHDEFVDQLKDFDAGLSDCIRKIKDKAQEFYQEHFHKEGEPSIEILMASSASKYEPKETPVITPPCIPLGVRYDGENVPRPHKVLNEAKLTQIALAIRFGATLTYSKDSDIKLLVIDDLLISLDMVNRTKVVDIILNSPDFEEYQKFILTHDIGLFREFQSSLGAQSSEWSCLSFSGSAREGVELNEAKTDFDKALEYLKNGDLEDAGNRLRKCAEANLTDFLDKINDRQDLDPMINRKEFSLLGNKLNEASKALAFECHHDFVTILQGEFSSEEIATVTGVDPIDHTQFAGMDNQKRGKLVRKLLAGRNEFQKIMTSSLTEKSRILCNAQRVLAEVDRIKTRILNPASHSNEDPLYVGEVEQAAEVINELGEALQKAADVLVIKDGG